MKCRTTRPNSSAATLARTVFVCAALLANAGPGRAQQPEAAKPAEEKLAAEFAGENLPWGSGGVFHKWAASPKISCWAEAVKSKPLVERFVAEMSVVLDGLAKPLLTEDNAVSADIIFVVDSKPKLDTIRRREGGTAGREGQITWNADKSTKRYAIFLPNTKPVDAEEVYRQLQYALGIWGQDVRGVPSFWSFHPTTAPPATLTEMDRKLIRFAYQFVPSGANKTEVKQLVRKHWGSLPKQ